MLVVIFFHYSLSLITSPPCVQGGVRSSLDGFPQLCQDDTDCEYGYACCRGMLFDYCCQPLVFPVPVPTVKENGGRHEIGLCD